MSIVGRLLYRFYFKPIVEPISKLKADGWFFGRKEMIIGLKKMKENSSHLFLECASKNDSPYPPIHFLTGKNHWYQTIYCISSLLKNISIPVHIIIHDDGTFDDEFKQKIQRQLKNCSIDTLKDANERISTMLPENKYPYLNSSRKKLPLLYKILDCRIGYSGYNIMLDSDMLFFNSPTEIIEWLKKPNETIYMQDKFNSYFYSLELLTKIVQKPIRQFVNAGIVGLDNDAIDWDEIEAWTKILIDNDELNYFLEQALLALLITKYDGRNLNSNDYVIIPDKNEVKLYTAHVHHYPTGYRQDYFRTSWRNI